MPLTYARQLIFGIRALALIALLAGCGGAPDPATCPATSPESADVVIYGGTPSGVAAAVAAARHGSKVTLVDPTMHLGGMVSGGLSLSDARELENIGGFAREFYAATYTYYGKTYGKTSTQYIIALNGRKYEPHVAEDTFNGLIASTCGISVIHGGELQSVAKTGPRIDSITTTDGRKFSGNVFIDASYEGDLMAAAGVRYVVGREPKSQYGELYAGVQGATYPWPDSISAQSSNHALLPFIQPGPLAEAGTGDEKVEAYGYRLCLTQQADILREFTAPNGYNEADYELLGRYLDTAPATTFSDLFAYAKIPNGKVDVNSKALLSTDLVGGSWTYPNASPAERRQIELTHRNYTQGLFYFLAHSQRVPAALRAETATWGLAKDEFVDNQNWPYQLYIREARRMLGQYVMTESNAETDIIQPDAIAIASYIFDSHSVQRVVSATGQILNEGSLYGYGAKPFTIPYRSILPKPDEASNLLVTVTLSASHVLFGAYRIEAYYMHVGQAAGVAASLAAASKVEPGDVPIAQLQAALRADHALLEPAPAAMP